MKKFTRGLVGIMSTVVLISAMVTPTFAADMTIGWYAPLVHSFFENVKSGVEAYAEEHGVDVEYTYGSAETQAAETEKLEALAGKGVKDFLVYPMDLDAANGVYDELTANGCNVINYAADTNKPTSASFFVGVDVYNRCTQQIEALFDMMGGEGNVLVVLEALESPNTQMAKKAYDDAIEKHSNITLLQECAGMNTVETATTKIQDALSANYGKIDGIVAYGTTCSAALSSLMGEYYANGAERVQVMLTDTEPEVLEAIKAGDIDATISQPMFAYGYIGCALLQYMREGYVPKEDAYTVDFESVIVTGDNVETFSDDEYNLTMELYDRLTTDYLEKE